MFCTILFEKLELPVIKKTPKGAPSTAEEVLQELALDYPLPKVLMDFSTAVLQIVFGLLLISFYHPFFIAFGAKLRNILKLPLILLS